MEEPIEDRKKQEKKNETKKYSTTEGKGQNGKRKKERWK